MTTKETHLGPVGTLSVMFAKTPYDNTGSKWLKDGEIPTQTYKVSLWHHDDDVMPITGENYLEFIKGVNSKMISRENAPAPGMYKITHKSKFQPRVYDTQNQRLEQDEIPQYISSLDTGTAQVEFSIYQGSRNSGTNLVGVQILSLEQGERSDVQVDNSLLARKVALLSGN